MILMGRKDTPCFSICQPMKPREASNMAFVCKKGPDRVCIFY